MRETKTNWLPTRRSLLERLRDCQDHASWQEFFDTYWRLIYGFARKSGLSEAEAEDVVQETLLAVTKTMPRFEYDKAKCPFKAWLLHLTRCRVNDYRRRLRRRQDILVESGHSSYSEADELENVADPANGALLELWEAEWRNNLAQTALERVKRQAKPLQFQIFDCYVLRNWPAREVARSLEVSLGQVYLARHRIGAMLRKETERLRRLWEIGDQGRVG